MTRTDGQAPHATTGAVFIDERVPDLAALIAGARPDEQVFILDPTKDGLAQIADDLAAAQLTGLASIAIVGHGTSGSLDLGSTTVDANDLAAHSAALAAIGAALAPLGQLDLYACNVASGAAGRALIANLARDAGGVEVAAATHEIGKTADGENWSLDASAGGTAPAAATPFSAATTQSYQGTLSSTSGPDGQLIGLSDSSVVGTYFVNSDGSHGTINTTDGAGTAVAVDPALGVIFHLQESPNNQGTDPHQTLYVGDLASGAQSSVSATFENYYNAHFANENTTQTGDSIAIDTTNHRIFVPIGSTVTAQNGVLEMTYSVDGNGTVSLTTPQFIENNTGNTPPSFFNNGAVYDGRSGNIYIADGDDSNSTVGAENGIFRISASGSQPASIVNATSLGRVAGLALDRPDDRLFYATSSGSSTANYAGSVYVINSPDTAGSTAPVALQYASNVTAPTFRFIKGVAYDENSDVLYVTNDDVRSAGNESDSVIDRLQLNASGTVVTGVTEIPYSSFSSTQPGAAPFGPLTFVPLSSLTVSGTATTVAGGTPVTLLAGAPTITDYDSGGFLQTASVSVTDNGTAVSGDVLGFTEGGTFKTVSGDPANPTMLADNGHMFLASYTGGTLTIADQVGTSGENTIGAFQHVLQDVQYENNSADANARTVTFQVNNGAVGDPSGPVNTKSFAIALDQPPTIVAGGYTVPGDVVEGASATAGAPGALTGDSDPNGGTLSITAVQTAGGTTGTVGTALAGTYGSLTLQSTGAYTYTASNTAAIDAAPQNAHPVDSNSFSVTNAGGSSPETFAATIDRAPTVVAASGTLLAGATSNVAAAGALTGDMDPDGDSIAVSSVAGSAMNVGAAVTGTYGSLTLNGDGSYSYAATNGLAIVTATDGTPITDTFGFVVSDGLGGNTPSSLAETISLGAGGTETVTDPSGSDTYTLGATTLTVNETTGSTFGGVIQDGSSFTGGNVVVTGTSPLTLTGASIYTGATTIENGAAIDLGSGGGIAQSSGVEADGTFDISSAAAGVSIQALTGANTGDVDLGANGLTIKAANGTFAGVIADGGVGGTGGSLTLDAGTQTLSGASTYSGGTTISGGTLDLAAADNFTGGGVTSGAAGTGAITFFGTGDHPATLALDAVAQPAMGATFGNTLASFGSNDSLDLVGLAYTSGGASTLEVLTPSVGMPGLSTLSVTENNETETFTLQNPGSVAYFAHSDGNGGTIVDAVCYASGTLIRAVRDREIVDVAVEDLVVGDRVVTASGERRPIRWLGHRTIDCRHHPERRKVLPVRIAAHAFGEHRPARDLCVSPGHSICVDVLGEVLIPAAALVNGSTIQQVEVETVTYWHVELDGGHDILLAENLAAESYLDMGNRSFFAEMDVVELSAMPDAATAARTHADFCRPFHGGGALVDVVRMQLAARAQRLGWRPDRGSPFADLHLVVDGERLKPTTRGLSARFSVPARACDVSFVSSTIRPCDVDAGADRRALGVWLAALTIDDGFGEHRTIALDDPLLSDGYHDIEANGYRWTAGHARLPNALWSGCEHGFYLRVDLAGPAPRRWLEPGQGGSVRLQAAG